MENGKTYMSWKMYKTFTTSWKVKITDSVIHIRKIEVKNKNISHIRHQIKFAQLHGWIKHWEFAVPQRESIMRVAKLVILFAYFKGILHLDIYEQKGKSQFSQCSMLMQKPTDVCHVIRGRNYYQKWETKLYSTIFKKVPPSQRAVAPSNSFCTSPHKRHQLVEK